MEGGFALAHEVVVQQLQAAVLAELVFACVALDTLKAVGATVRLAPVAEHIMPDAHVGRGVRDVGLCLPE